MRPGGSEMTWTDLYPAAAGELLEAVDAGPVVVTGLPGSGRADLVHEVLAGRHVVELDALAAATGDGLRQDATRAVIRAFAGDGAGRELKLAVARTFGPDAPDALAVAQGKTGVAWPTAAIFEALPSEVALLVHDAHLLHAPWA